MARLTSFGEMAQKFWPFFHPSLATSEERFAAAILGASSLVTAGRRTLDAHNDQVGHFRMYSSR